MTESPTPPPPPAPPPSFVLSARGRRIDFPRLPLVMAIVNVNDDSFSGDGTLDADRAAGMAVTAVADGADIVDIGAESARTNRQAITVAEEIRRLEAFHAAWTRRLAEKPPVPRFPDQLFPPLLSINTWRPEVAEAVLPLWGDILNDIGALPDDRNARICARTGAALLIMHSVGEPKVPHTHVTWRDVMGELRAFFAEKIAVATAAGVAADSTILDPGIDFAKQRDANLTILARCGELTSFGRPVLLPVSRKTVIGDVLGIADPARRDAGTVACIVAGCRRGASIFRVHHVRAAAEAIRVVSAADGKALPFTDGAVVS